MLIDARERMQERRDLALISAAPEIAWAFDNA